MELVHRLVFLNEQAHEANNLKCDIHLSEYYITGDFFSFVYLLAHNQKCAVASGRAV